MPALSPLHVQKYGKSNEVLWHGSTQPTHTFLPLCNMNECKLQYPKLTVGDKYGNGEGGGNDGSRDEEEAFLRNGLCHMQLRIH